MKTDIIILLCITIFIVIPLLTTRSYWVISDYKHMDKGAKTFIIFATITLIAFMVLILIYGINELE